MRWGWVNFHCRGVLLVWFKVGLGPAAVAMVTADLDIFSSHFSFLSPSLRGSLNPKQPTNQPITVSMQVCIFVSTNYSRFSEQKKLNYLALIGRVDLYIFKMF